MLKFLKKVSLKIISILIYTSAENEGDMVLEHI